MSNSIKDQLMALGLAKQADKPKRRKPVGKRPVRTARAPCEPSLDQAYRLREKQEKQAVEAKKEEKRLRDLKNQRINKEIQALVDAHKRNDPKAEIKRNFMYKGRIRSVLVTAEQLKSLNAAKLGVVFLRGGYYLVSPEHAEAARTISPDHVPDLGGAEPDDDGDGEHKVPDDLIW